MTASFALLPIFQFCQFLHPINCITHTVAVNEQRGELGLVNFSIGLCQIG